MVGKLKYIFVACIVWMILGAIQVQAECSYERTAELSRIASNVQFSYNYEMNENGNPEFTVIVSNLTNDIYIKDDMTAELISGTGEVTISYPNGSSIQFKIYSNDSNCYGEKILTQYVNLPYYNYFSNNDECQNYPNFTYCQMWLNTDITIETFDESLEEYKNELQSDDEIEVEESTLWDDLLVFWDENKIMIILTMICIIGLIIYVCVKKFLRRA